MKRLFALILLGSLLAPHSLLAQEPPKAIPASQTQSPGTPVQPPPPDLPKFDLDFPGGTPAELVEHIQAVTRKPINVIVPNEYGDTKLPAVKMNGITVPQLFEALGRATRMTAASAAYGFETTGTPREDSIWFFYSRQRSVPKDPKACRFYQLGPLLQTYKVEDITTAIETGWKMLGETDLPELKFHKDTRLLIAVGHPDKLSLIDSVVEQLNKDGKASGSQPGKAKDEPVKP